MSPVANGLLCQGQPESEMMQNVTVAQDCTPAHHLSLLIMWIECAHDVREVTRSWLVNHHVWLYTAVNAELSTSPKSAPRTSDHAE